MHPGGGSPGTGHSGLVAAELLPRAAGGVLDGWGLPHAAAGTLWEHSDLSGHPVSWQSIHAEEITFKNSFKQMLRK